MDDESQLLAEARKTESSLLLLLARAEAGYGRLKAEFDQPLPAPEQEPERTRSVREELVSDSQRERDARAAEQERVRKAEAADKHQAAKLRLGVAEKRLRELKRHAQQTLELDVKSSSVGGTLPPLTDITGLENALNEAEKAAREISGAREDLARRHALRNALEEAVSAYMAIIADVEEKAGRNESPAALESSLKSLKRAEAACASAAREASVSPDAMPRMREASERARAVVGTVDRLLGKFRRARRARRYVLVVLSVVALAILGHFALISRSTIQVNVALPDGLPEGGGVTAFLDDQPLSRADAAPNTPPVWRIPRLGQAELRVAAPGYDDFTRKIGVRYGANHAGPAELVRSKGRLSVTSDLSGADVRIVGGKTSVAGVAPCSFELPTGDYDLVVGKGLVQATHSASVAKGQDATAHVPVPRGGLELAAMPAKSRFTLSRGGSALITDGELPASLTELPGGDYQIDFRFGDTTTSRKVSVATGEAEKIMAVLPLGDLRIVSSGTQEPPTFRLLRAGREEANGKTPAVLQNLNEGDVEISASDGTFTLLRNARVKAGEETVVSAEFAYGAAKIESVPSPCDLELVLPGHPPLRGRTPFEAPKLLVGEYAVRLTFDGTELAGSLAVKGEGVAAASFTLPVGSVKIAATVKDAEHRVGRLDGTLVKVVPAGEETVLRAGDYVVKTLYRGILVESPVTIKTSLRTDHDPFVQTGTLYLTANATRAKYVLRSLGPASFNLLGFTPERIEFMPYGRYSATFTHAAEGYSETMQFEVKEATSEQMCIFSRNIFEAVKDREMTGFEAVTERFPQSRAAVWDAIYEGSQTGTFREKPHRSNASAGWVVSKRYTHAGAFNLAGPSRECYHVAMVSEMGDHREVQVVTVTSMLTITTQPKVTHTYSPDPDREKSRELSRKFLDDLKARLAQRQ